MLLPALTVRSPALAVAAAMAPAVPAQFARAIERLRRSDNGLSCQQISIETVPMDAVVARAVQPAVAAAPCTDPDANAGAQVADAVAQTAIAQGRTEHPTTLFLSECGDLGDMQK